MKASFQNQKVTSSSFNNTTIYEQKIQQLRQQIINKDKQFIIKKQTYQDIISALQQQNNRLKSLIVLTQSGNGTDQINSKNSKSYFPHDQNIPDFNYIKKNVQSQKNLKNSIQDHDFLHVNKNYNQNDSTTKKTYEKQKKLNNYKSNQNYFTLGTSNKETDYVYVYQEKQSSSSKKLKQNSVFGLNRFDSVSKQLKQLQNDHLPSFSQCSRVQDDSFIPQLKIPEQSYQQLAKQNQKLKQQITNLTNTYQKQLQQLTFYFQKLKSKQQQLSLRSLSQNGIQKSSKAHFEGQIKLVFDSYQSTVNDFKRQRQKYRLKILQIDQNWILSQDKIKHLQDQIIFLKNQLKISQQQKQILTRFY